MRIKIKHWSRRLHAMIAEQHDDGMLELDVSRAVGSALGEWTVRRADGSELSDSERAHVAALLAAHAAEPIR